VVGVCPSDSFTLLPCTSECRKNSCHQREADHGCGADFRCGRGADRRNECRNSLQLQRKVHFLFELVEGVVLDFNGVVEFSSIDHVWSADFGGCAAG
jgi:hypothetical protein